MHGVPVYGQSAPSRLAYVRAVPVQRVENHFDRPRPDDALMRAYVLPHGGEVRRGAKAFQGDLESVDDFRTVSICFPYLLPSRASKLLSDGGYLCSCSLLNTGSK